MELWNDFEGKVVDDQFRLGRLLAPKGRSAFFTATGARQEPVTVRLIESLNDEDEILARWRAMRELREPHLVCLLACGRTVLDGTHLVYAAMEPTDAELAEVLRERPLTADETRAMAAAVLAGLEAIHKAGLVHEHVEAANVLAQGEVIKLRSDCVREAPAGAAGETLRRRDAHDLAMLVGYALTQRRDAGQVALPRQFEDLVRNGMSGTWGLKEMGALLRPAAAPLPSAPKPGGTVGTPRPASAGPVPGSGSGSGSGLGSGPGPAPVVVTEPGVLAALNGAGAGLAVGAGTTAGTASEARAAVGVGSGVAAGPMLVGPRGAIASPQTGRSGVAAVAVGVSAPERMGAAAERTNGSGAVAARASVASSGQAMGSAERAPQVEGATGAVEPEPRSFSPTVVAQALGGDAGTAPMPTRRGQVMDRPTSGDAGVARRRWLIPLAIAGVIALLLLLIWQFGRGNSSVVRSVPAGAATGGLPGAGAVPAPAPEKPSAASGSSRADGRMSAAAGAEEGSGAAPPSAAESWRVVSFTYARQEQAQHRANLIGARHGELHPEVFAPKGRSPYLVTLGGWMTATQAEALKQRARRDGMPGDTYTQNYHGPRR